MKKISLTSSERLLVGFVLKALFSSVFSVLIFSFIASQIYYRLDIGTDKTNLVSLVVYVLSALIVAFISVSGFKNNGAAVGVVSQLGLVIYSLFTMLFGTNTLILFLIKTVTSVTIGAVIGAVRAKRNAQFRI